MKNKILSGCLMAASMFLASSCSDFLTEDPKGRLTPESFYTNQNEVDMAVYALYAKVQAYQCNSNPMISYCQGDDVTSTTGSNKAAFCRQMPLNHLQIERTRRWMEENVSYYFSSKRHYR